MSILSSVVHASLTISILSILPSCASTPKTTSIPVSIIGPKGPDITVTPDQPCFGQAASLRVTSISQGSQMSAWLEPVLSQSTKIPSDTDIALGSSGVTNGTATLSFTLTPQMQNASGQTVTLSTGATYGFRITFTGGSSVSSSITIKSAC